MTDKQTTIEGFTDVASNGRTSWFEVPTTITINDGKIISISVDDNKTNHHFGGQPLLGIVESFIPCSDVPGTNMELLPPCSPVSQGEEVFGLMNDTSAFPPSEEFMPQGTFPGEDFSQQGIPPDQGFPGEDFSQQGIPPDQGFPGEDFSQQGIPPTKDSQVKARQVVRENNPHLKITKTDNNFHQRGMKQKNNLHQKMTKQEQARLTLHVPF